MNRDTVGIGVLTLVMISGTIVLSRLGVNDAEPVPVDVSAEIQAKIGIESEFYIAEAAKDEDVLIDEKKGEMKAREAIINDARNLYIRRQNGDEPSREEWKKAEDEISRARLNGDSPELKAMDDMLERADATDKAFYDGEVKKLLEL